MLGRLSVSDPAGATGHGHRNRVGNHRAAGEPPGLRGFCISSDGDLEAALQIIDKSGLGSN